MKSRALISIIVIVCILVGYNASAQTAYSGYFLEDYSYRFQMNPAFGGERNFVAMPGIGNLNLSTHGSLGVRDVIYPLDGKTVLFTNPGISVGEVMDNINDNNRIGSNIKIDLMTVGFSALGGYNNVSLSALANVETSVPGALFSLAKESITNKTYNIHHLYANANAYAQLALNHSRVIKQVPGLRVGATLKFLLGGGNIDILLHEAKLQLNENEWIGQTNADVYASVGGMRFDQKFSDKSQRDYVSGVNLDDGYKLNGFGMGLDLGAEYKWRDFSFSLSVLDFGFMRWGHTLHASTDGSQEINTDAYIFNVDDQADNSFSSEWDRFTGDLTKLYELHESEPLSSRTKMLGATLNIGVSYELPSYRKLHFGFVNSTRILGTYSWTQFRMSANVRPIKMLSIDVNGVAGTYGIGFGWMFNFHTTGFNLFAGMDHTLGKLSKQYVPLGANNAVNFGINFPI